MMEETASDPLSAKRRPFSGLIRRSYRDSSLSTFPGISYPSSVITKTSNPTSSSSSRFSLSSLRDFISGNPNIYDISEIRFATNNFLAKSCSSSRCWRCFLRGAETIVFQRKFARQLSSADIKQRLAVICRSNHASLVKLLGAAVSGDYVYLVYDFISGANLADCLRNRASPSFTVLSKWISRIRIADDVAHALDYVHHKTGLKLHLVHKFMKSSGIMISEPSLSARICHFGASYLAGQDENEDEAGHRDDRSFEGVLGYMSPEFRKTGVPSQESDVYAFGVVLLELVSGKEPLTYRYDSSNKQFVRSSLIENANAAVEGGTTTFRGWVDRRLSDSFPVDVVEKVVQLALECVHVVPTERPDMSRVAAKLSKLYLASLVWSDRASLLNGSISVSLAPR